MADDAGGSGNEEVVDWPGKYGAKPKTSKGKERKKVAKDHTSDVDVVGGRGEEVVSVTRSTRARWATGYGSEEESWLVASAARGRVREEEREVHMRREVRRSVEREARRLDLAERLVVAEVEGKSLLIIYSSRCLNLSFFLR